MAIARQQNRLAIELAARTEGRIKTVPFTIQAEPVFDGEGLLGRACFMRLSPASAGLLTLTVEAVARQENVTCRGSSDHQFFVKIVAAQEGRGATHAHQPGEHLDDPSRADRAPTSMARHSRVNSSTTVRHLINWPSAQASKTKSWAQT